LPHLQEEVYEAMQPQGSFEATLRYATIRLRSLWSEIYLIRESRPPHLKTRLQEKITKQKCAFSVTKQVVNHRFGN